MINEINETDHYGHKIIMLWNSWRPVPKVNKFFNATTIARHFLRDLPQENITYSFPQRADTWFPSLPAPSPQRVLGRTYADVIK